MNPVRNRYRLVAGKLWKRKENCLLGGTTLIIFLTSYTAILFLLLT
jgi:hypothetical protein